ncbi:unnamed protein product [Brassica oleracea var. botrytis]
MTLEPQLLHHSVAQTYTLGSGLVRFTTTFTYDRVRLTKFFVKSSVSLGSPTKPATRLNPCWWRRSKGTPVK